MATVCRECNGMGYKTDFNASSIYPTRYECESCKGWKLVSKIGEYSFWKHTDEQGSTIYNVTKNDAPPQNESGYKSYEYILTAKNIDRTTIRKELEKEQS